MFPGTTMDDETTAEAKVVVIILLASFFVGLYLKYRNDGAVERRNYHQHNRNLGLAATLPSQEDLQGDQIGVHFNDWRQPVSTYGPGEEDLEKRLREKLGMSNLDIGLKEWRTATGIVDSILKMLFSEVAKLASHYRLSIDKFVRQGSSREGLKVCKADEFDSVLLFSINELKFEVQKETDERGRANPELGRLYVVYPTSDLKHLYPKLHSSNVFYYENGQTYLNSRMLHERVFESIIDRAIEKVCNLIDSSPQSYRFRMTRATNQPAVQVTLCFDMCDADYDVMPAVRDVYRNFTNDPMAPVLVNEAARIYTHQIDIDIVPALLIQNDQVPDPTQSGQFMDCPRYAVFKWSEETNPLACSYGFPPETVWRMDTSGYEKHVIDVAQGIQEQRYILTALRILKAVFNCEKKWNQKDGMPPPQTVTVLRSYFLKQLAFYCILYYTVLHKYPLSGVREALTILLDLLEICLEEQRLPHFFHANTWLCHMFPDYDYDTVALRFNVFYTVSPEALFQAKLDLRRYIVPKLGDFTCRLNKMAFDIEDKFRDFVREGNYLD